MAGSRIKGITIEIDGDTTKLTTALKNVEKEVRSTQMQLKDVNRLLKLDPGNTDLLKQKYSAMGKEIDATKQKLSTLKEAQKQMVDAGKIRNVVVVVILASHGQSRQLIISQGHIPSDAISGGTRSCDTSVDITLRMVRPRYFASGVSV